MIATGLILHSGGPNQYRVLAVMSAIGLLNVALPEKF